MLRRIKRQRGRDRSASDKTLRQLQTEMEDLAATDGVVAAEENKRLKLEKQAVSDALHFSSVNSHRQITDINKQYDELLAVVAALRQQVEKLTAENQKLQADYDELIASHPAYDPVKQPSGGTPQQHRSVAQYTVSPHCLPTLPLYTDRWAALSQG
jgi:regulator of replication initiation timing